MLSCQEASRLQSDRLDRPLRPRERFALRLHVAMCHCCSRAEEHLRFIRKAMEAFAQRRGEGDRPDGK